MVPTMDRQIPLTPHSRALLEHREELLEVARLSGLTNVRVFGSMARGDADENSDVDFLVAVPPGEKPGLKSLDLSIRARTLLGRKIDLVFDSQLAPEPGERPSQARIRESILEDAVPL